jgi:ribonuclease HI
MTFSRLRSGKVAIPLINNASIGSSSLGLPLSPAIIGVSLVSSPPPNLLALGNMSSNDSSSAIAYASSPNGVSVLNGSFETVTCFTDGSCDENRNVSMNKNNKSGWGFVIINGCCDVPIVGQKILFESFGAVVTDSSDPLFLGATLHSNNIGELSALGNLFAFLLPKLESILKDAVHNVDLVIRTDSQICENLIKSKINNSKNNKIVVKKIRELYSNLVSLGIKGFQGKVAKVSWQHVKGHSGNKWNDYVDVLAKQGAASCVRLLPSKKDVLSKSQLRKLLDSMGLTSSTKNTLPPLMLQGYGAVKASNASASFDLVSSTFNSIDDLKSVVGFNEHNNMGVLLHLETSSSNNLLVTFRDYVTKALQFTNPLETLIELLGTHQFQLIRKFSDHTYHDTKADGLCFYRNNFRVYKSKMGFGSSDVDLNDRTQKIQFIKFLEESCANVKAINHIDLVDITNRTTAVINILKSRITFKSFNFSTHVYGDIAWSEVFRPRGIPLSQTTFRLISLKDSVFHVLGNDVNNWSTVALSSSADGCFSNLRVLRDILFEKNFSMADGLHFYRLSSSANEVSEFSEALTDLAVKIFEGFGFLFKQGSSESLLNSSGPKNGSSSAAPSFQSAATGLQTAAAASPQTAGDGQQIASTWLQTTSAVASSPLTAGDGQQTVATGFQIAADPTPIAGDGDRSPLG